MCSDLSMEVRLSNLVDHKLPLCTQKWVTHVLKYLLPQPSLSFPAPRLCYLKQDIAPSTYFVLKILIRVYHREKADKVIFQKPHQSNIYKLRCNSLEYHRVISHK